MRIAPIQSARPGLYAPGLVILTGGVADAVKRVDPDLVTVWNKATGRFEIYDRAAPGGPKWQLVMRVKEPDDSYRPLDMRVIPTLIAARRPVAERIRDIEAQEEAHEQWVTREARRIGEDLAPDLKWMGQRVVPTVAWRDRTPPEVKARLREQIRLAVTPHDVAVA